MRWIGVVLLFWSSTFTWGLTLNPDNSENVKQVASVIARKLMDFYPGDRPGLIPGLFGDPYYWWEAGAVFGALVDYWHYTGDETYNRVTTIAMLHQVGDDENYEPVNQTSSLGNDDQAFWALAAMNAAEKRFPDPPEDKPQWLALVQAVFNRQVPRYIKEVNDGHCGGGLRWQAVSFNGGYDYKNAISNGLLVMLGARLARYTKNDTYAEWAERVWDWSEDIGFFQPDYSVVDGAWINGTSNCTIFSDIRWSYNAGVYLGAAAFMWDFTKKDIWKQRINRLLDGIDGYFFPDGSDIMAETACEYAQPVSCNVDQRSFKGYLARFMTYARILAPWTEQRITKKIKASAVAAASICNKGQDAITCSLRWNVPVDQWDRGFYGVGEQLAALEVVQSVLVTPQEREHLADEKTGTSKGNPAAGGEAELDLSHGLKMATQADKGGAGALTGLTAILLLLFTWWLVKD